MADVAQLERAIWSIADGRQSDADLALFEADERMSLSLLDRLIVDAEDDLASVRNLPGDERDQVVADFVDTLDSLLATAARLRPPPAPGTPGDDDDDSYGSDRSDRFDPSENLEPEEVQLQASWSAGEVVVWAAGRGSAPESNDDLATRLESIGGPPLGWQLHPGVDLPRGLRADALTIPMKDALGWLVAVGGGQAPSGAGASLLWLGRAAVEGVRLVASGTIVPSLRVSAQRQGRLSDASVKWTPAFLDSSTIDVLAGAMPGTVVAVGGGASRATTVAVITAVVETIMTEAVERVELPAQPPSAHSPRDLADTMVARMDGAPFRAGADLA